MNFKELLDQIVKTCKMQMRDVPGDSFHPMCLFVKNDKIQNLVLFDPGETAKEKAGVYTTLALTARKHHSDGVILVTDNWVSKQKDKDDMVMPSQDPNRQSALVISALMVDPSLNTTHVIPYIEERGYWIPVEEEEHQLPEMAGGLLPEIFSGILTMPASQLGEIEEIVSQHVDVRHIPVPKEQPVQGPKEIFRSQKTDTASTDEAKLMGTVYDKLINHPEKSDGTLN